MVDRKVNFVKCFVVTIFVIKQKYKYYEKIITFIIYS